VLKSELRWKATGEEEPHFDVVDLLIVGYLLEELTASQLLCPTMLILQALLFESHQGLTWVIDS
jgi:hypothetical protein